MDEAVTISEHAPIHLPVMGTGNAAEVSMSERTNGTGEAAGEVKAQDETAKDETTPAAAPLTDLERKLLEGKIIAALRTIYDPEIPVSIHELGLIYAIDVEADATVKIRMTLTAPACPVAGSLPGEVETKVESIPEVRSADVELVWEPPWCREMMSEAAQLQLGLM